MSHSAQLQTGLNGLRSLFLRRFDHGALQGSSLQRRAALAIAACWGALLAALLAPAAGLMLLAGLAAVVLMSGPAPTVRIDRLALIGLAATAGGAAAAGLAGAVGAVFCWYVVDAARQQARLSRAAAAGTQTRSEALHLWLAGVFAILIVAASAPHMVMGVPLDLPRPPSQLIVAAGLAYSIAVVDWIVRALARWRLGENPWAAFTGEAALHLALLTAFAFCTDVSAGVTGLVAYRLSLALLPESQRLPSSAV